MLEIAPVSDAGLLPSCTPSLMPFHISYTGPAPISRYFRPRPAPPSNALSLRSFSSATLVASSSSISILGKTENSLTATPSTISVTGLTNKSERGEDALMSTTESSTKVEVVHQADQATAAQHAMDTAMEMDSETQPASDTILPHNSSDHGRTGTRAFALGHVERFVAAFRGRQMYGQEVDMPSGYGGLVLRAPLDSKGKGKEVTSTAKPKSKTRAATGRTKRATVDDVADERERGNGSLDADMGPRRLTPLSTFSSIMLWTPDRPLDERGDEYVRALVEWTRLATEIHSYDE